MARLITATRTKRLISFARNTLGDIGYELFKTDDEIFDIANTAQDEIARETYCLTTPDIKTALVPDRWEYELIQLVDTAQSILRVDRISIIDTAGLESSPLTKRTLQYIDQQRAGTLYTVPDIYDFDGKRLYIWKPYSVSGYQIKIRCARFPMPNELIDYDRDPAIDMAYDNSLNHGVVAKLILSRKELMQKFNAEYYLAEFIKYKKNYVHRKTSESNRHDTNQYNLY